MERQLYSDFDPERERLLFAGDPDLERLLLGGVADLERLLKMGNK